MKTMKRLLFTVLGLSLLACGTQSSESNSEASTQDTTQRQQQSQPAPPTDWRSYSNSNYHFETRWPASWRITATPPEEPLAAINLYSPEMETKFELPLNVHSPAAVTHLSLFPRGWGTEIPAGKRQSLAEYKGNVPFDHAYDPEESYVLQLESGAVWAYLIHPAQTPANWSDEGYLFAQIAVDDFQAQCYAAENGEPIPMRRCNPMKGDRVERRGKLRQPDRQIIEQTLAALSFFSPSEEKTPISDLIQVETPLPNQDIRSPLTIRGKARGQWYFEGDFPVRLMDKNGKKLATGIARANGQWMTRDFVPFELSLEFDAPETERGYLLFEKSNASGKPEHDRHFRLPVLFSPR